MGKVVAFTIFYSLILALWASFEGFFSEELLEKAFAATNILGDPLASAETGDLAEQNLNNEMLTLLCIVFLLLSGWIPGWLGAILVLGLSGIFILGHTGTLVGLVWLILEFVFCAIPIGYSACFLDLAGNGNFKIRRLFTGLAGFTRFLKIVWLEIVRYVFLVCWSVLLIIPGIVKWYSYSMVYFVRLDNPNLNARQTITESRKLMAGNKFRLFRLQCRFVGWFLLCFLTLGFASFWVAPYYYTAKAHFYLKLKAKNSATEPETDNSERETIHFSPLMPS